MALPRLELLYKEDSKANSWSFSQFPNEQCIQWLVLLWKIGKKWRNSFNSLGIVWLTFELKSQIFLDSSLFTLTSEQIFLCEPNNGTKSHFQFIYHWNNDRKYSK